MFGIKKGRAFARPMPENWFGMKCSPGKGDHRVFLQFLGFRNTTVFPYRNTIWREKSLRPGLAGLRLFPRARLLEGHECNSVTLTRKIDCPICRAGCLRPRELGVIFHRQTQFCTAWQVLTQRVKLAGRDVVALEASFCGALAPPFIGQGRKPCYCPTLGLGAPRLRKKPPFGFRRQA